MQGKILVLDAIATNRIILKVKLTDAYYEVVQADSISAGIRLARSLTFDLVITALSLPDGTAERLCRKLHAAPGCEHLPVIAMGSGADPERRLAILRAGAQVLAKPVCDTLLLSQVRSTIRIHNAAAEWRMRDDTSRALGMAEPAPTFERAGRATLVAPNPVEGQRWIRCLRASLGGSIRYCAPAAALRDTGLDGGPDAFVLVQPEDPQSPEALRLVSALRANAATRHSGIMIVQMAPDPGLAAHALDLGADDVMTDGFEPAELSLRLRNLMRRKQMDEQMRATVRTGAQAAIFDPLTGLHNRRYAMPHLQRIADHARATARPFAVMLADLDHFKRVNDRHGHAAGDAVLAETATRLRSNLRAMDMVARIGGEEFMIVMPGSTLKEASAAALRLCNDISGAPFRVPGIEEPISVTISIGMAVGSSKTAGSGDAPENGGALLEKADKALYAAKSGGRNKVRLSRPAA